MLQLNPQETFVIVRGLEDHTDSGTYYVRAVIRNAKTDAIIDTVNLSNKGDGHRFSAEWQVAADPNGLGTYIVITTSVFSDSGYTTKSANYGDVYDTYLIQERPNQFLGGGGGPDIDYKKIQHLIDEAIGKLPKPEKITFPKTNLQPVIAGLESLSEQIKAIDIPENEKIDFTVVLAKIQQVKQAIDDKEIPKTDLSPVLDAIAKQLPDLQESAQKISDILDRIKPFFGDDVEEIKGKIDEMLKTMQGFAYVTLPAKQNNDVPID